jgi:putative ABC transport system ATP-binding protein
MTHPEQSAGGQPALRTERLTRTVDSRVLVDDVTITVDSGDAVAISGPSGSGKTSLLRLLNRLDEPTSGSVFLDGLDYRELEPRLLRRRVGMLAQRPYLFPGSVAENVGYGPAAHGETMEREKVEELLEQVGVSGYADRDVKGLSGGEAQRVSLARSLAVQPEVLLLDEPTSALDEAARLGIEELVCEIIESQGLTCLIVTHDREQATRMARRTIVMESGKVIDEGRR